MARSKKSNATPEVEVVVEEKEIKPEEPIIMKVARCNKLRIRKAPSVTAEVVKIIDCGTELEVVKEVENGFYEIKTLEGISGYCMKDFIK